MIYDDAAAYIDAAVTPEDRRARKSEVFLDIYGHRESAEVAVPPKLAGRWRVSLPSLLKARRAGTS
jgi:hypothetical protein